jgi:hypothetical protein
VSPVTVKQNPATEDRNITSATDLFKYAIKIHIPIIITEETCLTDTNEEDELLDEELDEEKVCNERRKHYVRNAPYILIHDVN